MGRSIDFVPVDEADRGRLSLTDDEVTELAAARPQDRGALRPPDGHRVGQGRRRRPALHPAGAARDGEVAAVRLDAAAVPDGRARRRSSSRVARSARRSAPARCGCSPVAESMHEFQPGEVLVADMTDPDWEPVMKRASAIVTNRGGRTCHAAIIARELGIPAVVGTGSATTRAHRRPGGHRLRRRGRHRPGLRRAAEVLRHRDRPRRHARRGRQDHDERRHPRPGVRVLPLAAQGNRARAARVHHQPPDRHPPPGAARARRPGAGDQGRDRGPHRRLRQPARLLRQARRRGRLDARGGVRAGAGDRADERLQVQRVCPHARRGSATSRTRRTR